MNEIEIEIEMYWYLLVLIAFYDRKLREKGLRGQMSSIWFIIREHFLNLYAVACFTNGA